jgi:hypothetical protein
LKQLNFGNVTLKTYFNKNYNGTFILLEERYDLIGIDIDFTKIIQKNGISMLKNTN